MKRLIALALLCAAPAYAADQPLVVIRFNQPRVYFEQPLYQAVSEAVKVKPGVMFEIRAINPATGGSQQNVEKVVNSMRSMGVPQSRMNVQVVSGADVSEQEIQIYAR